MPTLQLTDEQVIDLVKQLPEERQKELLKFLILTQWSTWLTLSYGAEDGARMAAAQRGRDWDRMSDEEREDFIDEVIHEDRQCR